MHLTLFTDYSMRTLMYLAIHNDSLSTVRNISDIFRISHNHMVKVVHNLARLGYIESIKGKGGGIRLAVDPEDIRLKKLITELEPNFNLAGCFGTETNHCAIFSICGLRTVLGEALDAFLKTLEDYTLADVIKNGRKSPKN